MSYLAGGLGEHKVPRWKSGREGILNSPYADSQHKASPCREPRQYTVAGSSINFCLHAVAEAPPSAVLCCEIGSDY